jgi:LPXTG-motif cell wall-anchored protein
LPGATIRLDNPGSQPVTFALDVTYPATSSHIEVTVAPAASRTIAFEPPPYWRGVLPDGAALPACGATDELVVKLTLSAPGATPRTLDSCAYLHLAAAAPASAPALTFSVGAGPTGATAGISPVVVGAAVLLVLLAAGAGWLLLRRRAHAGS